jgi:hypothetical protein
VVFSRGAQPKPIERLCPAGQSHASHQRQSRLNVSWRIFKAKPKFDKLRIVSRITYDNTTKITFNSFHLVTNFHIVA